MAIGGHGQLLHVGAESVELFDQLLKFFLAGCLVAAQQLIYPSHQRFEPRHGLHVRALLMQCSGAGRVMHHLKTASEDIAAQAKLFQGLRHFALCMKFQGLPKT